MDVVNLGEKLGQFEDLWNPRVVAELNGQLVKLTKLQGEFVWHSHEHEDELFYIVSGELEMHLRDRVVRLGPGELCVVPRGVEHKPVAPGLVEVMLFEPASTVNTGDAVSDRTVTDLERL